MIRFYLYRFAQWIVRVFPLSVSFSLACFLSDAQYFFSAKDRKAVHANIESLSVDPSSVRGLAREVFRNFGRYLVEFLWMGDHFDPEIMDRRVTIIGREFLEEASSHGKGIIAVTGHIGNWEMGAAALRLLGYKVSAIALEHPHSKVNAFFDEQRRRLGVQVVPASNAVQPCLNVLRKKNVVAIVAERDFYHRGFRLPFLSKTAEIPKGPAMFALKTGAPILPMFFTRGQDPMTFELRIHPPIYPEQFADGDIQLRMENIIKAYLAVIEQKIRDVPGQWVMFREYDHA